MPVILHKLLFLKFLAHGIDFSAQLRDPDNKSDLIGDSVDNVVEAFMKIIRFLGSRAEQTDDVVFNFYQAESK
jgi:hypothetical protein